MAADEGFQNALRDALNRLYEPDRLRTSPLVRTFALPNSWQSPAELQQLLLEAIQDMQPPPDESAASIRRRIYHVLQLRYEQQFSQKEVAAQLGIGVRQYRRLQNAALQALTLHLAQKYDLVPPLRIQVHEAADELPEDLQWLDKLPREESAKVDQVVKDAVRLVEQLAWRHNKSLQIEVADPVSGAMPAIVLRQALLTLLNVAILQSGAQTIVLRSKAHGYHVQITLFSERNQVATSPKEPIDASELTIARQMMQHFGGDLTYARNAHAGAFHAELRCRSAELTPVLVVDDHTDTLALLQRYTADTRYSLIVVSDPLQAVPQAALHQPGAILLDVMMPKLDGWDVITQLKQDERTAHMPVLVCTVLDQSELALSLGASGFLRKPITRQELLAALDAHERRSAPAAQ